MLQVCTILGEKHVLDGVPSDVYRHMGSKNVHSLLKVVKQKTYKCLPRHLRLRENSFLFMVRVSPGHFYSRRPLEEISYNDLSLLALLVKSQALMPFCLALMSYEKNTDIIWYTRLISASKKACTQTWFWSLVTDDFTLTDSFWQPCLISSKFSSSLVRAVLVR